METMERIDIIEIERRARALRAAEMQRLTGLFGERIRVYVALVLASVWIALMGVARLIRPLFSWNPQDRRGVRAQLRNWTSRANSAMRGLFAWNPRHTH